jgi:Flp pilus assembly protein TadG
MYLPTQPNFTSRIRPALAPCRPTRASLRDEGGTALVEFALVLPMLLAVLVGILSFGRAMNYDEQATHLANEAARYAAVDSVPAGATGTLGQWVRSQVDSPELANSTGAVSGTQVCIAYGPGGTAIGQPLTVTMKFTFSWLPVLNIKAASTTITRTATMRIEGSPTDPFFASGCS